MTLHDYVGPWIYWPIVTVAVSGAVTWVCNSISILYTEIGKQIAEIQRVKNKEVSDGD